MPGGVEGVAAPAARWTPRLYHLLSAGDQRRGLLPGEPQAPDGGVVLVGVVVCEQLLGYQDQPVALLVVGDLHAADPPQGLDREEQLAGRGHRFGGGQVGEQLDERLGQHGHLLLLHLQGHDPAGLRGLQVEHPPARGADRPDRQPVGVGQVEALVHDGRSSPSEPVELTASTVGPVDP